MYKTNTILSSGGIILGLSIVDIATIFGIIYTAVNLGILIFTIIRNIVNRVKDGKFDENEKQDTAMEILKLTETIKDLQSKVKEAQDKEADDNDRN